MKLLQFFILYVFHAQGQTQNNFMRLLDVYNGLNGFATQFQPNFDWPGPNSGRYGRQSASATKYDFIVVGSGSAGSILANRLSEISSWKVLLLEAGQPENLLARIPFAAPFTQITDYNWKYATETQPDFGKAMIDNKLAVPRGKALGGSSVINMMVYTRGHPEDYNNWVRDGNPGWSYQELLPHFIDIEQKPPAENASRGYLNLEDGYRSPLSDIIAQAGLEAGYLPSDYKLPDGFAKLKTTTMEGTRFSSARGFLDPARKRRNFTILNGAFVTKILIEPTTKRAFGVEYVRNGKKYKATASKEVLISGGSINSPQLLMLSGIGPSDHLNKMGIPVIQELPVGRNLQDHVAFLGLSYTTNQTVFNLGLASVLEYLITRGGPLKSGGGGQGLIFANTDRNVHTYPNVELLFSAVGPSGDYGLLFRRIIRVRDEVYYKYWRPIEGIPGYSTFVILLHPKSRGYVELKSKNPYDHPLIYGNHLSDPEGEDIKTLIKAIRLALEANRTPAFQKVGSTLYDAPIPGCESYTFDSDEYWECGIRTLSFLIYHPLGTCKMGPANSGKSVVDNELRVYGVQNLRVIDASIMPFPTNGHIHATATMIGSKGAQLVKQTWLRK